MSRNRIHFTEIQLSGMMFVMRLTGDDRVCLESLR